MRGVFIILNTPFASDGSVDWQDFDREVAFVDVPGHERFIKNMLAGVGGVDAALLVIAADEGPMPQAAGPGTMDSWPQHPAAGRLSVRISRSYP